MTNDIRLEIEDTESGTQLTTSPTDAGVLLVLEDDNNEVSIDLDASHAYTLANIILQILEDSVVEETVLGNGCQCGICDGMENF